MAFKVAKTRIRWENLRHSCSTLLEILIIELALKTMNARSSWKNGLFSRPNGLTRCRFFHSFHSWKNLQLVRPFGLSKRPFFHLDLAFIVFRAISLILFTNNVEKNQFYIYFIFHHLFTGLPDSNQVFWGYGLGPWDWSKIKVWPKISCIAVDFFLVLDLRDLWRPLKFRILGFLKFYSPYKFFQKKNLSMGAAVADSKSHWTSISELFWWFGSDF